MPIIDSRSNAKFDALIRTNKDDSLMSFIKASYNVKESENRKELIAKKLKETYDLFKEKGAGTYGNGGRDLMDQFESHYTMGYEMGIWIDSDLNLSSLAKSVADYTITVREYIGIVFFNLFTYYVVDGQSKYHHFLYELLRVIESKTTDYNNLSKELISESLPISEKISEQTNLLFNYLVSSDIFTKTSKETFKLNEKWGKNLRKLIEKCNLEYSQRPKEDALEMAKDKKRYSDYVSQTTFSREENTEDSIDEQNRIKEGENVLFYGVPGSGKSHTIETQYGSERMTRVVFHPDYMSTDFVGQILPTVKQEEGSDEKLITYEFTPGPFTNVMEKAYKDPENMYYLVIEEINRGNAPAIFGEIFQLLDRDEKGTSKYAVVNYPVARAMYGNEQQPIRIPSNLTILATMNTSDQNVFTLDTAFQRRWTMCMIINDIEKANHKEVKICDTDVTWKIFNEVINDRILNSNATLLSSEDKRLGAYFVTKADLEKEKDVENRFSEKVIKYLWDDAFKFSRDKLFEPSFRSLEQVIQYFVSNKGEERFGIFNSEVKTLIEDRVKAQKTTPINETDSDNSSEEEEQLDE